LARSLGHSLQTIPLVLLTPLYIKLKAEITCAHSKRMMQDDQYASTAVLEICSWL